MILEMKLPNVSEIRTFMAKARSLIKENKYDILEKREKYVSTLRCLGIKKYDVLQDICGLSEYDSSWFEVEEDKDKSFGGKVWQCKKVLHNVVIYIKLKIKICENGEKLLVLSYHIDSI